MPQLLGLHGQAAEFRGALGALSVSLTRAEAAGREEEARAKHTYVGILYYGAKFGCCRHGKRAFLVTV